PTDLSHKGTAPCSAEVLKQELTGFRLTSSPLAPEFVLHRMLAEMTDCRVIKERVHRQVYYLETREGSYFLKRSSLTRSKDRIRHFFLPRRRWAEWRNLHRLHAAGITAPSPVLRGENTGPHPKVFFLLTKAVHGDPLPTAVPSHASILGRYLAHLHACGVYHADLHPENILIRPDNEPCLIDVQEVIVLPSIPRRLRIYNLGKFCSHMPLQLSSESWIGDFLREYNRSCRKPITEKELNLAAYRHQKRDYRSRTKRCFRNSTEFAIVNAPQLRGCRRRDFHWGIRELKQALEKGRIIKPECVLAYEEVCIKIHKRRFLHQDRCRASWRMSRALEVRGISVPRSLGYFVMQRRSYFVSEFLLGSIPVNDYISWVTDGKQKRRAVQKLALWLREIHDQNIWQKDLKSSNVLCHNGNYFLVDLDGVQIRRISEDNKITNLAQLNASFGNNITLRDRLRFYYHYSSDTRLSRGQRRNIYRKIWDITKTKNTSVFGLDIDKLRP
ncbi:MAG: lipopolysaccharide kinase InaA family protein, partial [Candidatus Hodarchaeota archaeon]